MWTEDVLPALAHRAWFVVSWKDFEGSEIRTDISLRGKIPLNGHLSGGWSPGYPKLQKSVQ